MHYVISNLYGNMVSFEAILEKIKFSENDHLFILGNATGRYGIRVLREIMNMYNITLINGPMEEFILDWYKSEKLSDLEDNWGWLEGTHELLDHLIMCKEHQPVLLENLIEYLYRIPYNVKITVNENIFNLRYNVDLTEFAKASKIICNDGIPLIKKYKSYKEFCLFDTNLQFYDQNEKNIIIFGKGPVTSLNTYLVDAKKLDIPVPFDLFELTKEREIKDDFSIFKYGNHYCIDSTTFPYTTFIERFTCLRLEDLLEFHSI